MPVNRMDQLKEALGTKEVKEVLSIPGGVQKAFKVKKAWYRTKINWGFWIFFGAFVLWAITWFVVRPMLSKGG